MLLKQGDARSHAVDRRLGCVLAMVAGALNAVAFHAVGFFAANMTGNVSSLSDRVADHQWWSGIFYLSILVSFVAGASFSTLAINAGRRRNMRTIYAFSILAEALLMTLLGAIEVLLASPERGAVLVLGLSFLMGLQNAAVTLISDARVRTTHISGMSTDIGISLGMLVDIARGREAPGDAHGHRIKLELHARTVLAFLAGGVVGVVLYGLIGVAPLLFGAAAVLSGLAVSAIMRSRGPSNGLAVD